MRNLLLVMTLMSISWAVAQGQAPKAAAPNKLQPLNVKLGLWQNTTSISSSGSLGIPPERLAKMTPEQRARIEAALKARSGESAHTNTYKSCLTKDQLEKTPFADKQNCTEKLMSSNSKEAEVSFECTMEEAKGSGTMKIEVQDNENVQGSGHGTMTMGGHTMNTDWKMTGKWVQSSCGDVQ
jgi:Protein of unknown function (DUF3617)